MSPAALERIALLGNEIEYLRVPGRRSGSPAIVFLHEGLGSVRLWRSFPAALAERTGCPALIYSRAGNGFSSVVAPAREPGYMHDEALTVLPALLEALGIGDVVLAGHSDGGSIALIFAGEHPERVRGLVLEAPHLFVEVLSLTSIAAMRTQYETTGLRERMSRHHADANRTFYGWNDVWLSPAFASWNIESHAARVSAPVLVVQGTADEYGTLAQLDALAAKARGSVDRLVLADCGHAPHADRPEIVVSASAAWIDEKIAR
ncbi:MAG: alpha/beta hydrolase [Candidatus Eremiobacteraeota bacterium]|nr:alpha/beta hydrolase [Candidatus Eremiobacteraeota bacterium]